MIYPIRLYGDPILNSVSNSISKNYPNLTPLISDMYETMHKAGGIGLAAIQIGIPINIFIVEAHLEQENFHFREVFINPVMEEETGELVQHPEGCLSIPGLTGMIERHDNIKISYYDQDWKYHTKDFSGYKARIIQHEYDHLLGIVYPEKLNKMWEMVLERPLQMIKERRIETHYLSK